MKNHTKKSLKASNGITLIALVITIIVLLILAGISISMLSGDNGILQRATDAKTQTEQAELKEQKQLNNLADTITEINVGNKVWAKLYDEDNDGIGEVLVLDNHKDFSYDEGTLIKQYENENQNYMSNNTNASLPTVWAENKDTIVSVVINGDIFPNNTNGYFMNFSNLENIININKIKTKNVVNMSRMFAGCRKLENIDLSSWDTSNVTDTNAMFTQCDSLTNINLKGWNTSNVTNMTAMFCANGLTSIDLSEFDTSKVTSYGGMFSGSSQLNSITVSKKWTLPTIESDTNSYGMFGGCGTNHVTVI